MSKQLLWRPLPLAPSHGIPVLLVAVSIGAAAYTVRVTDMANVWVEDLDRKAICMRGWDENTSIDPSDTPENMAKLLSSLRSALDLSQPGHEQTSLTLSPGSTSDAGEDGLIVRVTCPLPGLQPLKWPLHLKKSPPSSLATDLVLPLIQEHYTRKLEVESLVQSLNHKDAVIAKLVDKLEATGTGLENVFTGLSGKKRITRALAGEKIKGLAPFSTRQWKASLDPREDRPTSASGLIQRVFGENGMRDKSEMEIDASPGLDSWWRDFKKVTTQPMHRGQSSVVTVMKTASPVVAESANDGDDDFEVQATPPHLRSRKTEGAAAPYPDDASTASEDGDDDDDAAVRKQTPATSTEQKAAPQRGFMGVIGGKKPVHSPQSREASEADSLQHKAPVAAEDSETASDAETASVQDEAGANRAPAPAPASPSPSPPSLPKGPIRKGGLGRIGGVAPKEQPVESSTLNSPSSSSPRRKPGMIGRVGGATSSKPAAGADGAERGRAPVPEDKKTPIEENKARESSQERANRRREELKKELERKAAAGPAKKKRRF